MIMIKVENKIKQFVSTIFSYFRSLYLFGDAKKVTFGRFVSLSGPVRIGNNVVIQNNSKIRGNKVQIGDGVYIHENVFIRGRDAVIIGEGSTINRNTCILDKVVIGKYCSIAPNCVIVGSNHNFSDKSALIKRQGSSSKGIVIEDDVWIAANVTVLDGVRVGRGAVIAAGAVVNSSVEPFKVVGGIPAKVIGERK
ncbi:acyltransferase [Marinobacter sp. M216]|uniref:Acyltransferase n=1 Tax=Marinobacter albus TaxID=3030833 RepID=A0ABT7HA96_9GAMM|nr:acyltransferase [Marinobacter sp. M216]MDK9557283.1 acyltransferase [Marinobacter sp. M216]